MKIDCVGSIEPSKMWLMEDDLIVMTQIRVPTDARRFIKEGTPVGPRYCASYS